MKFNLLNCGRTVAAMLLFAAMLCLPFTAAAQTDTSGAVSGLVLDIEGQPVVGVSVLVKGTTSGTTTGTDGRYQLTNLRTGAVLTFSFLGFQTEEVAYGGQAP